MSEENRKSKELIFIVGPTAVGKTKYAIDLANRLNTEIISADSRQIFKEMNIGTAKPTAEELALVPHHFIGNKSIMDYYNASKYEFEVIELLENLFKKYDKLIVAGGSGLYVNAILYGIDDLPTIDTAVREALFDRYNSEGIETLRFELKKLDPISYKKIDMKNHMRILKALEVSIQTGKPYSSFLLGTKKKRSFCSKIIVLDMDRAILHQRINKRVDLMVDNGLLDEAKSLMKYRDYTSLKTVGYSELFDYFDGKTDKITAIELIKRNTRRYARRQLTWFRKYENAEWIKLRDMN